MTPENAPATEPQPAGMSEFSRLTGVFFEPSKTFADIAERPRWLVPLVLVIVAALAYTFSLGSRIGWERIIDQQMQSRMATMNDQQRAAAEQMRPTQLKIAPIAGYGFAVIGIPIYYLVASGVLLLIAGVLMSGGVRYKQIFAIMCYAGLPGIILTVLMIASVYMKANPDEYNIQNPLPFNLGWFMSPDSPAKFLRSVATSIDLFSFWTMFLIATGLKAGGGKKLSFGGALTAVAIPWALYVLIKSALA